MLGSIPLNWWNGTLKLPEDFQHGPFPFRPALQNFCNRARLPTFTTNVQLGLTPRIACWMRRWPRRMASGRTFPMKQCYAFCSIRMPDARPREPSLLWVRKTCEWARAVRASRISFDPRLAYQAELGNPLRVSSFRNCSSSRGCYQWRG